MGRYLGMALIGRVIVLRVSIDVVGCSSSRATIINGCTSPLPSLSVVVLPVRSSNIVLPSVSPTAWLLNLLPIASSISSLMSVMGVVTRACLSCSSTWASAWKCEHIILPGVLGRSPWVLWFFVIRQLVLAEGHLVQASDGSWGVRHPRCSWRSSSILLLLLVAILLRLMGHISVIVLLMSIPSAWGPSCSTASLP